MSSSPTDERVEVTLPDLGEEQATLVAWKKKAGDPVAREEPLCLIVVRGVHAEVGSPAEGVIAEIIVPAGTAIEAGEVLAEVAVADVPVAPESQQPEPHEPEPVVHEPVVHEPEPVALAEPEPLEVRGAAEALRPPVSREVDLSAFRSPAVRRLAATLDVDLDRVRGTGRGGRVTRDDVLAYAGEAVPH